VPAAEYQPTKRLKLMTPKVINTIRFGRLLEQQPEWVWATVESVDADAPLARIGASAGPRIPPAAASE
jgi:hypothetical protein